MPLSRREIEAIVAAALKKVLPKLEVEKIVADIGDIYLDRASKSWSSYRKANPSILAAINSRRCKRKYELRCSRTAIRGFLSFDIGQ